MSTFKTTFRVLFAQRVVIVIYVFALCCMMFGLSWSTVSSLAKSDSSVTYDPGRPEVSIINRDGTQGDKFVAAMTDFVSHDCDLVDIGSTDEDLQTAVASNYTDLIVILPANYTDNLVQAISDDTALPELDVVTSYTGELGTLARLSVEDFVRLTRMEALSMSTDADLTVDTLMKAAAQVNTNVKDSAQAFPTVSVAPDTQAATDKEDAARISFETTLKYGVYPILTAMLVCTALAMGSFNNANIRRRLYSSPRTSGSLVLQEMAACALFGVGVCVFYYLVSLALPLATGLPLAGIPLHTYILGFVTLVLYGMIGVAAGFMLSMFTFNEVAINGFANVLGLLVMFTSGTAFPVDMMPKVMINIGKLLPGWWYCQAIDAISGADGINTSQYISAIGITVLYALAFICLGLIFSRIHRRRANLSGSTVIVAQ